MLIYWNDEAIGDDDLVARLDRARPLAVEIRMDASPLTYVLAAVQEAGIGAFFADFFVDLAIVNNLTFLLK